MPKRGGVQSAAALEMPVSGKGAGGVVAFAGEERSSDVAGCAGRDVEPEAVVSTGACGSSSCIGRGSMGLGGEGNAPEQVDPTKHLGGGSVSCALHQVPKEQRRT